MQNWSKWSTHQNTSAKGGIIKRIIALTRITDFPSISSTITFISLLKSEVPRQNLTKKNLKILPVCPWHLYTIKLVLFLYHFEQNFELFFTFMFQIDLLDSSDNSFLLSSNIYPGHLLEQPVVWPFSTPTFYHKSQIEELKSLIDCHFSCLNKTHKIKASQGLETSFGLGRWPCSNSLMFPLKFYSFSVEFQGNVLQLSSYLFTTFSEELSFPQC